MLATIDERIAARQSIMFETTLATLTYARKIANWRSDGYAVALIYLRLPSVEAAIARVRRRVEAGGHDIPERTIRQRFSRSQKYFEDVYKGIVDEWYLWDSLEGDFIFKQLAGGTNRIVDQEKAEAALKRAAKAGVSGPREARAGMFNVSAIQSRITTDPEVCGGLPDMPAEEY